MNHEKIAVSLSIIFLLSMLVGLSILFVLNQPQNVESNTLVAYPDGSVIFSVQKGNWTAYVVGSNPLLAFNSINKTEVEQWAVAHSLGEKP